MTERTFRHFKGGLYRLIAVGQHHETFEHLAVYRDEGGRVWLRPSKEFFGQIADGRKRFEEVVEPQARSLEVVNGR